MTAFSRRVLQMRLIVQADDFEDAVRFNRDVLGAAEELQLTGIAVSESRFWMLVAPRLRSPARSSWT